MKCRAEAHGEPWTQQGTWTVSPAQCLCGSLQVFGRLCLPAEGEKRSLVSKQQPRREEPQAPSPRQKGLRTSVWVQVHASALLAASVKAPVIRISVWNTWENGAVQTPICRPGIQDGMTGFVKGQTWDARRQRFG